MFVILRVFVSLFVILSPGITYSETIPYQSQTYYYVGGTSQSTTTHTDPLVACVANNATCSSVAPNTGQCFSEGAFCGEPANWWIKANFVSLGTCPEHYTNTGTACYRDGASCGSRAGEQSPSGLYDWGTSPDSGSLNSTCKGGCAASFSGAFPVARALVDGVYHYFAQGRYTVRDEVCGASTIPADLSAAPAPSCGSGPSLVPSHGTPQWLDSTTAEPVNPPGGSLSAQTTVVVVSNEGGGTTTTTTQSSGQKDIVVKDSAGNVTSTRREDADPLKSFCEENPRASVCSKSSFAGSCTTAFSCEGDAAACAAARAVNELNCKFAADASLTNASLLSASGLINAKADFDAKGGSQDVSGFLKFNERSIAVHTCPAPYSVSVLGSSLEFSWQPFCDLAGVISVFLLMGSTVLSVRIFSGGV